MVRVALRAAVPDRYGAVPTHGTQVNIGQRVAVRDDFMLEGTMF